MRKICRSTGRIAAILLVLAIVCSDSKIAVLATGMEGIEYTEDAEGTGNVGDVEDTDGTEDTEGTEGAEDTDDPGFLSAQSSTPQFMGKAMQRTIQEPDWPCVSGTALINSGGEVYGTGILDGTGPWDTDDERGNDQSDANGRVRSNDTVTYKVETTIDSRGQSITGQKIWYEFTVQDDDELTLDHTAMGIAEPEKIVENGKKTFRFSIEIPDNAAAGSGAVETAIILKVGNQTEGFSVSPEIRVWYGENSEEAKEHAKTVENVKAVTVTSAPMYNIILKAGSLTGRNSYDFTGNSYNEGAQMTGFGAVYGIALEMANTETSKGIRGIELPDSEKDFIFQVILTGTYTSGGKTVDIKDEFTPLLYEVKENDTNLLGVPYSNGEDERFDPEKSCADSGSFTAVQEGNVITFKVKGYEAESGTVYPKYSADGRVTYYTDPAKILEAVFSSFQFTVVWPYQNDQNDTLQAKYGDGSLNIKAEDMLTEAFSAAGNRTAEQTKNNDDVAEGTRFLTSGGGQDHQIFYSDRKNWTEGTPFGGSGHTKIDDSDVASSGQEIAYTIIFTQGDSGEFGPIGSRAVAVDQLVLFEDAVEVTDPMPANRYNGRNCFQCTALYAAKRDGTPLEENEIYALTEDDLIYSTEKPENCVGVLYQWRGCYDSTYFILAQGYAQVRPDAKYTDTTCMIAAYTRVWDAEDFQQEMGEYARDQNKDLTKLDAEDYMNWAKGQDPSEMVQNKMDPEVYEVIDHRNGYVRPCYDEEGYHSGVGFAYDRADTIYVVPYYTQVTKTVAQTDETGKPLITFNISTGHRYVDYKITGAMSFAVGVEPVEGSTTTVTLTDTIPKGLTYVTNSARWGDCKYSSQDDGKSPGLIAGGTQAEPDIMKNVDGSVTLTWTIEDVALVNGDLPTLYYSCKIGDERYPSLDVSGGTSLSNTVTIRTAGDKRSFTSANKNISDTAVTVINSSSFNIHKTGRTDLEMEDQGWFELLVSNAADRARMNEFLFDSMPADGKNGTVIKGSYQITSITIDPDPNAIGENGLNDVKIYYTNDPDYAGLTSVPDDLTADEVKCSWEPATLDLVSGSITGEGLVGGWPAAIAYIDDELGAKCAACIKIEYEAQGAENDKLNNYFIGRTSTASISEEASVVTYYRDLEGTVWLDEDRDGLIGEDEERLSGVTVNLQILTGEQGGNPVYENYISYRDKDGGTISPVTVTDKNGHYKFQALPAGTYRVVFSSNENSWIFDISEYVLTESNVGGDGKIADNSKISSSAADEETGKLREALIEGIVMPALEEMKANGEREYHKLYQNCGLWREAVPAGPSLRPVGRSSSGTSSEASARNIVRTEGAKTGDDTLVGSYLMLLVMACSLTGLIARKRMHKN